MTQPPDDDTSPGHDALALALATKPDLAQMVDHSGSQPVEWQRRFAAAVQQFMCVYGNINGAVKDQMYQMPDDWQGEFASLINSYKNHA
jgi:hypothetical protein